MTPAPQTLKIIAFPGAPNLPLFAAQEQGFLHDAGIDLELSFTPSSKFQFEQFAVGDCDIVFTAFDNVVAYREGQGAVKLPEVPDFCAILGATQLELSAVISPEIKDMHDLQGKTLALDAVSTGFAFVFYEMLQRLGVSRQDYESVAVGATPERWQAVKAGQHAGTMTIEPFTSIASAAGFNVAVRSTDIFDAYQGGVIAVRRDWAQAHAALVSSFLRVYLRGLDWVLDPANREAAAALLQARMPDIKPGVVGSVMQSLLSPRSGLTPGGAMLPDGMRTVLELRSRYGRPEKQLTDIEAYLDRSFLPETAHS